MTAIVFVFSAQDRKPIQGASVVLEKLTITTDQQGRASFNLPTPGSYTLKVSAAGYQPAEGTATFGQYANISDVYLTAAVPTPAASPGEREISKVGTQCRIVGRPTVAGERFYIVDASGNALTAGFETLPPLRERAISSYYPQCFAAPAAVPKSFADEIREKVDSLFNLWNGLEAWLVEHILDIIWRAMNRDTGK